MSPVPQSETVMMTPKTKDTKALAETVSDRKRAGVLFLFGSMLFLLLTTASEAIYPNFSLQTNAISDLAALGTSTAIIEGTAILGLSITWILGMYYIFRNEGRKGLMILNLLPGIGFLLAGVSPENVNLAVHSVGALLSFPFGAIIVIRSYRMIGSRFRYFAVGLGAVMSVSTFVIFAGWRVVCGTCGYTQGLTSLALGLGGWESLIIYPLIIWLVGFGNYLLTTGSRPFSNSSSLDLHEHERI